MKMKPEGGRTGQGKQGMMVLFSESLRGWQARGGPCGRVTVCVCVCYRREGKKKSEQFMVYERMSELRG